MNRYLINKKLSEIKVGDSVVIYHKDASAEIETWDFEPIGKCVCIHRQTEKGLFANFRYGDGEDVNTLELSENDVTEFMVWSEKAPEPAGDDIENSIVMKLSADECSRILKSLRVLMQSLNSIFVQMSEKSQAINLPYHAEEMQEAAELIRRFAQATGAKLYATDTYNWVDNQTLFISYEDHGHDPKPLATADSMAAAKKCVDTKYGAHVTDDEYETDDQGRTVFVIGDAQYVIQGLVHWR